MIIMKKLSSLLIGCSLALAGAALAQQPVEQQSPSKGKRAPEKARATQAQPGSNEAKPQERPSRQTGATNEPSAGKNQRARVRDESANTLRPGEKQQPEQQRKEVNAPATAGKTSANPAAAGTNAVPPASGAGQQNAQARGTGAAKKPAQQQVQQVKSQHASFRAQPKPQQVPPVTFNQNHRIEGSEHWQGHQYEVFRSYHPEWHDEAWYHSHYPNVTLIAGGYYFFNNGYWFPAWGYSPSAQYYAYDGPIYVGQRAEPPDKVIADTQALLQQMGYYTGEVDGLLGPLTREALAAYQADQGLATTASIDEPTLASLGLA